MLCIGAQVMLEVTGLRNPCAQIEAFRAGLLSRLAERDAAGRIRRKAGIMSVVRAGGVVRPGDAINVILPEVPHRPLNPV